MLARVRASFDRQEMMSTLGVEVTAVEPGKVEMSHAGQADTLSVFLQLGTTGGGLWCWCGEQQSPVREFPTPGHGG